MSNLCSLTCTESPWIQVSGAMCEKWGCVTDRLTGRVNDQSRGGRDESWSRWEVRAMVWRGWRGNQGQNKSLKHLKFKKIILKRRCHFNVQLIVRSLEADLPAWSRWFTTDSSLVKYFNEINNVCRRTEQVSNTGSLDSAACYCISTPNAPHDSVGLSFVGFISSGHIDGRNKKTQKPVGMNFQGHVFYETSFSSVWRAYAHSCRTQQQANPPVSCCPIWHRHSCWNFNL